MVVGDDVWMPERAEDVELGRQLLPLFLRHLDVVDFFPAEYLKRVSHKYFDSIRVDGLPYEAICFPLHFANDPEGTAT